MPMMTNDYDQPHFCLNNLDHFTFYLKSKINWFTKTYRIGGNQHCVV